MLCKSEVAGGPSLGCAARSMCAYSHHPGQRPYHEASRCEAPSCHRPFWSFSAQPGHLHRRHCGRRLTWVMNSRSGQWESSDLRKRELVLKILDLVLQVWTVDTSDSKGCGSCGGK